MKVNYRQGIVTSQTDSNRSPTFLTTDLQSGYVSLVIIANSTIINFAHAEFNYLYEEANTIEKAWGPFDSPRRPCYWLYWDIDNTTGIRSFGATSLQPITSNQKPNNPDKLQMWFNLNNTTMYEYDGYGWVEKIRVFAGTYANNVLTPYVFESQANLNDANYAGFILFDDNDLPLSRSNNGKFLTTESHFYTTKSVIGTVKFDTDLFYAGAIENIPSYSAVCYYDDNQIAIASSNDSSAKGVVGLIRNEVHRTEVAAVVTNGYVVNTDWDFRNPPATPLYLGTHGSLQTTPPQSGFIQKVGIIVSRDTILVDIDPPIIYNNGGKDSLSSLSVDLLSGKLYTNELLPIGSLPSDVGTTDGGGPGTVPPPGVTNDTTMLGVSCIQKLAKMKWIIAHNLNSKNIFVQVHDDNNDYVIPNSVTIIDQNTIEIYFNAPMAGTAQLLVVLDPVIVDIPDLNQPTFEFTFPTLSNVWHVQHDIGYLPITRVYNSEGVQITPYSIEHISTSNTVISFVKPRSGFVRMI